MSNLIKEFQLRLGIVKIYDDKVECTSNKGLFGIGGKVTEQIEFSNIKRIQTLGIEELNIGIKSNPFNIRVIRIYSIEKDKIFSSKVNGQKNKVQSNDFIDIDLGLKGSTAQEILEVIDSTHKKIITKNRLIEKEKARIVEEQRLNNLKNNILQVLDDLDKNKDGQIDLIENDFNKLFSKNQKRVLEIDKNYIHQFVKVSNFIKTKKHNTERIFESIKDTVNEEELNERVSMLKNQIHAYELLVFHSINMIGALVSDDLITFYEIYESFDKLGMFKSTWENEVSEKLSSIGDKLDDLMYSIYNMEQNIVSELNHLSYVTQNSFNDLNQSVIGQLREVESSINLNNLLTGIQTYQLYKINKNTKSLVN